MTHQQQLSVSPFKSNIFVFLSKLIDQLQTGIARKHSRRRNGEDERSCGSECR